MGVAKREIKIFAAPIVFKEVMLLTADEISERYQIPLKVLKKYEEWGLCRAVKRTMDKWRYDNQDLEHLSMIMTLHDMGFTSLEVETYMKLLLAGDSTKWERMKMLNEKRSQALDEIHLKERQLERMDYLRNEIRNNK